MRSQTEGDIEESVVKEVEEGGDGEKELEHSEGKRERGGR